MMEILIMELDQEMGSGNQVRQHQNLMSTMVNMIMIKRMDLVNISGQMALSMKDFLKMT